MRRWMLAQLDERKTTGMMMWATPAAIRNTCRRWVDEAGNPRELVRCSRMFDWMRGHVGHWNSWMMRGGSMMGTGLR
jgi:hypothetical protein